MLICKSILESVCTLILLALFSTAHLFVQIVKENSSSLSSYCKLHIIFSFLHVPTATDCSLQTTTSRNNFLHKIVACQIIEQHSRYILRTFARDQIPYYYVVAHLLSRTKKRRHDRKQDCQTEALHVLPIGKGKKMSCIFQLCVVRSSRSDYCESRAHPGGGGAFALIKAKTIDGVNNARAKKTKSHGQQNTQKK